LGRLREHAVGLLADSPQLISGQAMVGEHSNDQKLG
jgi:hypothetical protein